jgi:hypothetical protein
LWHPSQPRLVRLSPNEAPHLIGLGFQPLHDHACWTDWELGMGVIGTGGTAFYRKVQELCEANAYSPTDPAERDALVQQVLDHCALLVSHNVVFGAGHKLASAGLALMMLFAAVNMAVFLELWRATLWACVSDDHGGCGPP